jgi:transcriptional regulator with XRE-family HTH domain
MEKSATPGGNHLKALREYMGKPQMEVELDADLGIGYLQRVESGKVRHPERETLERILTALSAHYTERRDILELFGYVVDTPLPIEDEIKWAIETCKLELASAVFPVYLLDCAHRLLTWNRFMSKLFRLDRFATDRTYHVSMLRIIFDSNYGVTPLISNPVEFFRAQIRALRYEMRLFRGEAWYSTLIEEMLKDCPIFVKYWAYAETNQQESYHIAARPLVPLELRLPGIEMLRFRIASEPFAQDKRFRIIYYIPADSATIGQCVAWSR